MRFFSIAGLLAAVGIALSGAIDRNNEAYAPATVFALPDVKLPRDSPESRAVAALANGWPDEARRIASAALAHAAEPSLGRLRWLLAKATPDIGEARIPLEALAKSSHPLAPWARLRLTERLRERDPNAAAASADILLMEPDFRARAEQLLALSLYAAGRTIEAEPLLRALVAESSERSSASAFAMPLAAILSAKSDLASQKQALALYRRVITHAAASPQASEARVLSQGVINRLPAEERHALADLSADQAFAEAESFLSAREYQRAIDHYVAIAQRFRGDPKSVCDARLGQGKALFAANKRDAALYVFEDVTQKCNTSDVIATAHYNAGRVLLRRGDPNGAIAHYDAVARDYGGHALADDALLAAATAFEDLGDTTSARDRLHQLLALDPNADRRPDAHFMLGLLEHDEHRYDAALVQFSKLVEEGPNERSEGSVGRAEYWRARTQLDLEQLASARQSFIDLITAHPLTYYGQQALARLQEIDKDAAQHAIDNMRDEQKRVNLRMAARPELQKIEFVRAIELMRVGETGDALDELDGLGCFRPDADDDLYLLAASLLQEFGADAQAMPVARRRVMRVMREAPRGQALARWRVVFPRAFRPLIDEVASNARIPAAFVRAIAREESSFDANAVSPANAYGLIQLIRPTARIFAKPLHLATDPDSLRRPEINLRIGVAFMHNLFEHYKSNLAIVPAAYNAGTGAADRWLRERPNMALDEWIESIPYTETRRYTRRVLQSYGAYAWLDEGRIPPLPKALPHL